MPSGAVPRDFGMWAFFDFARKDVKEHGWELGWRYKTWFDLKKKKKPNLCSWFKCMQITFSTERKGIVRNRICQILLWLYALDIWFLGFMISSLLQFFFITIQFWKLSHSSDPLGLLDTHLTFRNDRLTSTLSKQNSGKYARGWFFVLVLSMMIAFLLHGWSQLAESRSGEVKSHSASLPRTREACLHRHRLPSVM